VHFFVLPFSAADKPASRKISDGNLLYSTARVEALLISDVGTHLVVVSHKAEVEISSLRQKENAQIKTGTKLKIFTERTQSDPRVQMRPAKHGFQPRDSGIYSRSLL